jgi:transposase
MARHDPAKIKMAELMLRGMNWEEAVLEAGVLTSRSGAYWFLGQYCLRGEQALEDRRRGQAYKLCGDRLEWLLARCREAPESTSQELQAEIMERYGLQVSTSQINRVRAEHRLSRPQKKQA